MITSVLFFIIAIALLVGIHEWGHYVVAKRVGVKILRFSIGFGPKLFSRCSGETEFSIGLVPLGGYVRMLDEKIDVDIPEADKDRAFNRQSLGAKAAIVVAGPLMNFVFAICAYFCVLSMGFTAPKAIVGDVIEGSIADFAGLEKEHEVLSVNGKPAITWEEVMTRTIDGAMTSEYVVWQIASPTDSVQSVILNVRPKTLDKMRDSDFLSVLGMSPYTQMLRPVLNQVFSGGSAARAGLKSGDLVVQVDGGSIGSWKEWVSLIRISYGKTLQIDVLREGSIERLSLTPDMVEEDGLAIGRIGASVAVPDGFERIPSVLVHPSVYGSVVGAIDRTYTMSVLTLKFIKKMITGHLSTENLSGPISIAKYAGQSAELGISKYLEFLALISVSLGVLNLLPIPMLDGGHLLYYLLEFVGRRPVPEVVEAVGLKAGFVILIGLMGTALYNDLIGLF